ncbi:helix-turn-helix domain-containing protein [Nocardioides mangrovi]|uniref:Helix-turn-helix domain-containing protein n=1 Tax=Nocardioides mangrovi TaxID=2874580 RepID=A0ABS7U954_9ACTN|nr:helix-turn-helix transcriptional regulator [Nocardioides mangrovi]MBZ5737400.1 helix-turn-helix domain-containing protein [Nocardioides mangrovi]
MQEALIDLSRTIDLATLGDRVRAARLRAGLTQAQVAADTMSVGYISRIESGSRRPDPTLLETIAERLGVTVDELLVGVSPDRMLELRVMLDHAELALGTGSPQAALEPLARILSDPQTESVPDLRRRASYLQASALEGTGDLEAAIMLLEDLAESGQQDLQWLTGLTTLCRCYRISGELGRAIEIGNRGIRFIQEHGLEGLDEAIRHTLSMSSAYFEQGDTGYAARLCRRAIERAEETASPIARASAYWNLSVMESERGNAELALPMTERALRILESTEESQNIPRLRSQLGMIQLRTDPPTPEDALEILTRAGHELAFTGAAPTEVAINRLGQARARFLMGELPQARILADETVEETRNSAPVLAAEGLALLGQVAALDEGAPTARTYFHEAVLLLSGVGADQAVAQLWFELAGLLEGVGDMEAALDAYRRAGASTGLVRPVAVPQRDYVR